MKLRLKDITKKYVLPVLLTVVLTSFLGIIINGVPIFGIPDVSEITEAIITRNGISRTLAEEDIKLAHNLVRSLSYTLGSNEEDSLEIKVVFFLNDGTKKVYGASDEVIYINGEYYNVKNNRGERFVNLAEAIFFIDELANEEKVS